MRRLGSIWQRVPSNAPATERRPCGQTLSWRLLLVQSLVDLDSSLRALNSRLIVLQGNPRDELPRAFREWGVKRLVYEIDTESYAKQRDAEISTLAQDAGVEVVTRWGHTMCDLDALLKRAGGKPTTTYSSFLNHFEMETKVAPICPVAAPTRLPPVGDAAPATAAVPTIEELGYAASHARVILPGGETEALRRLRAHLQREAWAAAFEKPNTCVARSSRDLSPQTLS